MNARAFTLMAALSCLLQVPGPVVPKAYAQGNAVVVDAFESGEGIFVLDSLKRVSWMELGNNNGWPHGVLTTCPGPGVPVAIPFANPNDGFVVMDNGDVWKYTRSCGNPCAVPHTWVLYSHVNVASDAPSATAPSVFLRPGTPNPTTHSTSISFGLDKATTVTLRVYDAAGKQVRTLENGTLDPGEQSRGWDGRDDYDQAVAAGVYFVRLQTANETLTEKIVLAR